MNKSIEEIIRCLKSEDGADRVTELNIYGIDDKFYTRLSPGDKQTLNRYLSNLDLDEKVNVYEINNRLYARLGEEDIQSLNHFISELKENKDENLYEIDDEVYSRLSCRDKRVVNRYIEMLDELKKKFDDALTQKTDIEKVGGKLTVQFYEIAMILFKLPNDWKGAYGEQDTDKILAPIADRIDVLTDILSDVEERSTQHTYLDCGHIGEKLCILTFFVLLLGLLWNLFT